MASRVGELIEVTTGVKAGDVVAISHVNQLADGAPDRGRRPDRPQERTDAGSCSALRQPAGVRVGPDPLARRRRAVRVHAAWRRPVPNVDIPTITVTTRLPGAAPEQIESEITDKIEEAVNTISGIDQLNSNSAEGISQVIVTFRLDKDADVAAQDVRDRVNRILPLLPRTIAAADDREAGSGRAADPHDGADGEQADPRDHRIRRQGAAPPPRERRRRRPGARARRTQAADQRLARRRASARAESDASTTSRARFSRRTRTSRADSSSAEARRSRCGRAAASIRRIEFGEIVVRDVAGHPVRVNDVARVEDGEAEATTLASLNGEPTVMLQIRKQSGTEHRGSRPQRQGAARGSAGASLPAGYSVRLVRDQSEFIEASISSLQEHLIIGSLLASLVVLLFLGNLRSTIIAAISIPTSIVATFGLVWYMGFTLNMLTMLALTLAVGIVIDDAIVVLENIYRFIEEKGMPPMQAAVEATQEIGLAVMATTLSLVAIFVPVGFMSGMVGRFMKSFGLTMAFAVMVSLLVAFTLTPMMSARWLKVKPPVGRRTTTRSTRRSSGRSIACYTRLLEWSMAHRGIVARRGSAGAALERAALPRDAGHLHAAGRHVRAGGQRPDARGHEPRGDRCPGEPHGHGREADARGRLHDRHRGRRRRGNAQHRKRVYEAEAAL